MRVALVWLWCGFGVALGWPWGGFAVALGWRCTPESMPSICLVYGFEVALKWLAVALAENPRQAGAADRRCCAPMINGCLTGVYSRRIRPPAASGRSQGSRQ